MIGLLKQDAIAMVETLITYTQIYLKNKKMYTTKGKVCLAQSIYTFPVFHTHNKMFIFITNHWKLIITDQR